MFQEEDDLKEESDSASEIEDLEDPEEDLDEPSDSEFTAPHTIDQVYPLSEDLELCSEIRWVL